MTLGGVAVVGGGRVGQSLARALVRSGLPVSVLSRSVRRLGPPLGEAEADWRESLEQAAVIILAVPDDAIPAVADRLATTMAITGEQVVLHCSGMFDRTAFGVLESTGAALGSWHPLVGFASESTELRGVPAVLEGDRIAVGAARELAERIGMAPVVEIQAEAKPRYHAAAVFASNYLVVLASLAERLVLDAGLKNGVALFGPLMHAAVDATIARGPVAALTGPVRRGDLSTVMAHLAALGAPEREVYRLLALQALAIAERDGLGTTQAEELRQVLLE